ncbi:acetylglutamate kinase [Listeria rocourtiae]|uniref:acetylglutamate kinase n=1 Tax=Listeria rocourtiae TaxID=647910 RepID=UPI0016276B33|nr:acetylglutamate kinase [Listeria rocourtiae]MBC1434371.1 acetylglutamate kinase [Listeria rocourtiae]MBC1603967.1 acetylglutamate kinase [Listeria rocourtiae]
MSGIIVVKIGGVAGSHLHASFFNQIKTWQKNGKQVVLVHGGGVQINKMMEALRIPVETKAGLRVTTKETLAVAKMVLIGQVQPEIVTALLEQHISAIGLHAGDTGLIQAEQLLDGDLGFVGEITHVETDLIQSLIAKQIVPVIAPLGLATATQWLNVNADLAACAVAEALQAEKLILLTDVAGVLDAGEMMAHIDVTDLDDLFATEVITGGMIPKLKSAKKAVIQGVREVAITNEITKKGTIISEGVKIG